MPRRQKREEAGKSSGVPLRVGAAGGAGRPGRVEAALGSFESQVRDAAALRESGAPVLAAVSGGRDSVALLHALVAAGWKNLVVCHLNHGLRGRESALDAALVRRLARDRGLRCEVAKADVAALAARTAQSVETAGRAARHGFLARMMGKHAAAGVFLAHHADDQAETILAALCRGAGARGLGGMMVSDMIDGAGAGLPLRLLRPLLQVRRADIDSYVERHGLEFREDASNASLEHRRNRLRHEVLPLLRAVFDRDVAPVIARCGVQAARDEECLRDMARRFLEESGGAAGGDGSLAVTPGLRALPAAIRSRVFAEWLQEHLGLRGIGFEEIEAAQRMIEPGGPAKMNLPGGKHLRRKAKLLWVE